MDWSFATEFMRGWGPGILILVGIYLLLRDFNKTFFKSFLSNQSRQCEAMEEQGQAISKLCLEISRARANEDVSRREILIAIKVQGERLEEIMKKLNEGRPA